MIPPIIEYPHVVPLSTYKKVIIRRDRYITHFCCLAVEADFYSNVVECLPVDQATWVRFPTEAGKIISLYDNLV